MRPQSASRLFAPLIAAALLLAACAQTGTPGEPVPVGLDPVSSPEWARDMARFAEEDAARPPPAQPVVFTGSSSVRLWKTLAKDFPGVPVLNRGFGGSQVRDAAWYADEVAIRYQPRRILVYAGDNDINAGRTPAQVLADFQAFVARVHRDLPGTPVGYLAIKPSPSRVSQLPAQQEANALVRAWAERTAGVDYVDVATPMLDARGQPREELFIEDRLHMNDAGYALWRDVVAPWVR